MNELVALLAVGMALFILGSVFGLTVYHLILRLVRKGESAVKDYASAAEAKIKSVL